MGEQKSTINLDNVRLLLQWINDIVDGEIIETTNYTKFYFKFRIVSEDQLDMLCSHINQILNALNYPIRICWIAGEIRPVTDKGKIQLIDFLRH